MRFTATIDGRSIEVEVDGDLKDEVSANLAHQELVLPVY